MAPKTKDTPIQKSQRAQKRGTEKKKADENVAPRLTRSSRRAATAGIDVDIDAFEASLARWSKPKAKRTETPPRAAANETESPRRRPRRNAAKAVAEGGSPPKKTKKQGVASPLETPSTVAEKDFSGSRRNKKIVCTSDEQEEKGAACLSEENISANEGTLLSKTAASHLSADMNRLLTPVRGRRGRRSPTLSSTSLGVVPPKSSSCVSPKEKYSCVPPKVESPKSHADKRSQLPSIDADEFPVCSSSQPAITAVSDVKPALDAGTGDTVKAGAVDCQDNNNELTIPPIPPMTCDQMRSELPSFSVALPELDSIPESVFSLRLPSECDTLCRLYQGLEQAWRQRRARHQPLLLSYSEDVQSLAHHVERLTFTSLKLAQVRKLYWLAPHLLQLSWKKKPRIDVYAPEAAHWDLEVAPIDPDTRMPIVHPLSFEESAKRQSQFAKMCLLWVKCRHDEFLRTEDPPIVPIPFSRLASWHHNFRLEDDHVPLPEAPLPSRPWYPRRDSTTLSQHLRLLSPWRRATPLSPAEPHKPRLVGALCTPVRRSATHSALAATSPRSGTATPTARKPLHPQQLRGRTPLRQPSHNHLTSGTASSSGSPVDVSLTETPKRTPYKAATMKFATAPSTPRRMTPRGAAAVAGAVPSTPQRSSGGLNSSSGEALRTPLTALGRMSLAATPFTSRRSSSCVASRYMARAAAASVTRHETPSSAIVVGDVSRMTPDQRRVWDRTKSREREKNIEMMLQKQYDGIDEESRSSDDCLRCYQECVSIFLRSDRTMLQLPALCKRICQSPCVPPAAAGGQNPRPVSGPGINPERAAKAIAEVARLCPDMISLVESKADRGVQVVVFRRDADLASAKEKLLSKLHSTREAAEKAKRSILQQFVPQQPTPTSDHCTLPLDFLPGST